eukprot:COSAG02_NODE_37022_length_447_cov_1.175287_2_plen_105_part_01
MGNVQACCSSVGGDAPTPQAPPGMLQGETEEIEDFEEGDSKLASLVADDVANVEGEQPLGRTTPSARNVAQAAQAAQAAQVSLLGQLSEDEVVGLESVSLLEAEP